MRTPETPAAPAARKQIVQVRDYYHANVTVPVRVVVEVNDYDGTGFANVAELTAGQIAKLKRQLPNGPRGFEPTEVDRFTGKDIAGRIYFTL
jgi:hypothetical protein